MFIVKKKSEVLRFGLFLMVLAGLVWYVSARVDLWRLSQQSTQRAAPASTPLVTANPTAAGGSPAAAGGTPTAEGGSPAAKSTAQGAPSGAKPAVPLAQAPAQPAAGASGLQAVGEGRDYFAEYRIDRERTRGALGERLKELMDSANAPDAARQQATEQYLKLSQTAALESQAEALVKARGYDDVIVHLTESSAQVVVKAAQLSQQQFLQVVDTVSRVTGIKSSAVTVLAKYQ